MKFLIAISGDGIPDNAPSNKREEKEMIEIIEESLTSTSVSVDILWKEGDNPIQTKQNLLKQLKKLMDNCGDNLDREGNYISDQLEKIIDVVKRTEII